MNTELSAMLKAKGLHVTAQRIAVFKAVQSAPHCTADEAAELVRTHLGTVSRQAVYDALGALAQRGILRRIQTAGSPARYECRAGDNHHHLICRRCGKTVDVDCAAGSAPCLTPSDAAGFHIDEAEVVYWGICPECQCSGGGSTSSPSKPLFEMSSQHTQSKGTS